MSISHDRKYYWFSKWTVSFTKKKQKTTTTSKKVVIFSLIKTDKPKQKTIEKVVRNKKNSFDKFYMIMLIAIYIDERKVNKSYF